MALTTINASKELSQTYQPLLLATITLIDGTALRYSTHGLSTTYGGFTYLGNDYEPKIKNEDIDAVQAMSDLGIDMPPSMKLVLEDTDKSLLNDYEFPVGFEGALVDLTFVMWDVGVNSFSSDQIKGKFSGRCSAPQVTATTLEILVTTKLNLTQTYLPSFHIQSRCSNLFASTAAQRADGCDDSDSPFFGCGYSPDISSANQRGNFESGSTPFTTCDYTKDSCVARGMYSKDSSNRNTGRFTGSTWIPVQTWQSRGFTDPNVIQGFNNANEGKFNDLVPRVWGTAFIDPIVMNVVGDANITRMEVLVCDGDVGPDGIQLVIVNDIEVGQAGNSGVPLSVQKKVGLWWNFVNQGSRDGGPNPETFYDSNGDPYGGLCVLTVTVPRALASSDTVPRVKVLCRGPMLSVFGPFISSVTVGSPTTRYYFAGSNGHPYQVGDSVTFRDITGVTGGDGYFPVTTIGGNYVDVTATTSGAYTGTLGYSYAKKFSQNQAVVLADQLVRLGYTYADFDFNSMYDCVVDCGFSIDQNSIFGGTTSLPRYSCNLPLRQRTSGATLVRNMRTNGKIILVPNSSSGLLGMYCKKTVGVEQPSVVSGSNFNTKIRSTRMDGTGPIYGYVAYKFDATTIARKGGKEGQPDVTVSQRTIPDCINSVSIGFQDSENSYVPDSLTVNDPEKITRIGQMLSGGLPVDGIPTFDQGRRVTQTWLAEMYRGNPRNYSVGGDAGGTYSMSVGSSFRIVHLRIGHIVLVDHPQYAGMSGLLQDDSGNPIDGFLARVIAIKPSANFETATIVVTFHNDLWYQDLWGQQNAPSVSNDNRGRLARPPFGWMPATEFPASGDVLYDPTNQTFAVQQNYDFDGAGNPLMKLIVTGNLPVNNFSTIRSPYVPLQGTTATTGGHLSGGLTHYVAVCARDTNGLWAPAFVVKSRVFVPAGTSTNTITISGIKWNSGTTDWGVWAGTDLNYLALQGLYSSLPAAITTSGGVNPSSITLLGTAGVAGGLNQATTGLPDGEFDHIEFGVKQVLHSGVMASRVTGVSGQVVSIAQGGDTSDKFAGHILSILSVATMGLNVPIANYTISHNDTAGHVTLSVTGPSAALVQVGDVVVVRSKPGTVTSTTMQDVSWANAQYPSGLTVNAEKGNIIRFVAGTGVGTTAIVASNTANQFTVTAPWTTTPDATSVFIVEAPGWSVPVDTTPSLNTSISTPQSTTLDVRNFVGQTLLIKGWTADPEDYLAFDQHSPFREIYMSGVDPMPVAGPITTQSISESKQIASDGSVQSRLVFTFSAPSPLGTFAGVYIYAVGDGAAGHFSTVPTLVTSGPTSGIVFITPSTGEFVTFYFVSYNTDGVETIPITSQPLATATLNGQLTAPNQPTTFTESTGLLYGGQVLLAWDANSTNPDIDHFELARVTSGSPTAADIVASIPGVYTTASGQKVTCIETPGPRGAATWIYYVRAVNTSGLNSAWTGPATVTALAPDGSTDIAVPSSTSGSGSGSASSYNFWLAPLTNDGVMRLYVAGTGGYFYGPLVNGGGLKSLVFKVTYTGGDGLGTKIFTFGDNGVVPGVGNVKWFPIDIPNSTITQILVHGVNYYGAGADLNLFIAGGYSGGFNSTVGFSTGSQTQDSAPSGTIFDPSAQVYGASRIKGHSGGNIRDSASPSDYWIEKNEISLSRADNAFLSVDHTSADGDIITTDGGKAYRIPVTGVTDGWVLTKKASAAGKMDWEAPSSGPSLPLSLANGGTGVDNSSVASHKVFAAPNGSTGAMSNRLLAAADIPAIDAATQLTGVVPYVNGGSTGTFASGFNATVNAYDLTTIKVGSIIQINGHGRFDGAASATCVVSLSSLGVAAVREVTISMINNSTPTELTAVQASGTGFTAYSNIPSSANYFTFIAYCT